MPSWEWFARTWSWCQFSVFYAWYPPLSHFSSHDTLIAQCSGCFDQFYIFSTFKSMSIKLKWRWICFSEISYCHDWDIILPRFDEFILIMYTRISNNSKQYQKYHCTVGRSPHIKWMERPSMAQIKVHLVLGLCRFHYCAFSTGVPF